jgi:hypothetical protein
MKACKSIFVWRWDWWLDFFLHQKKMLKKQKKKEQNKLLRTKLSIQNQPKKASNLDKMSFFICKNILIAPNIERTTTTRTIQMNNGSEAKGDNIFPKEKLDEKCQSIYYNLYTLLTYKETTPSSYLREWLQTTRCDDVVGFKEFREVVEKHCTKATMKKIGDCDVLDQVDENRAESTMTHYRSWHKQHLWSALSAWNKTYYVCVEAPQEALAILGIIPFPYGGYRAAMAINSQRKEMRRAAEEILKKAKN